MTNLTPLQCRVFSAAKNRLKDELWYMGVCMDDFPTDEEINKDFEGTVSQVMAMTAYWDAPGSVLG